MLRKAAAIPSEECWYPTAISFTFAFACKCVLTFILAKIEIKQLIAMLNDCHHAWFKKERPSKSLILITRQNGDPMTPAVPPQPHATNILLKVSTFPDAFLVKPCFSAT